METVKNFVTILVGIIAGGFLIGALGPVAGILVVWLGCSIFVWVFAHKRGRFGFGWFVLALLFSPLLAFLIVLALNDLHGGEFEATQREIEKAMTS
jgi:hypothetical protein